MTIANIVSVPIGNMLDITLRALTLLKQNTILCENPNTTKKLLSHYNIKNKPHKLNQTNCKKAISSGRNICLVSDAGTPLISDPGQKAISLLSIHNYEIKAIPGANAITCALVCSKLPANKFLFAGFLSKSKHKAKTQLIKYANTRATTILFESPKRIKRTIKLLIAAMGKTTKLAMCVELTKLNELTIRGRAINVYGHLYKLKPKGEITLVVWSNTN